MTPLVLARLFDPPSELDLARARRDRAARTYADAKARHDTRDMCRAELAHITATHAVLRLEPNRG